MSTNNIQTTATNKTSGWSEFWSKEDWWAVWLGLGIVLLAYVFYLSGSSISWIAVAPAKWSNFSQLATQLSTTGIRYLALLAALLLLFTIVIKFIGQKPTEFIPAFIFIFVLPNWRRYAALILCVAYLCQVFCRYGCSLIIRNQIY